MENVTPLLGVVEDDTGVRESLEELLAAGGYRVVVFCSAEAFLDAHGFTQVDCLISDVGLPGMSGCELMQIARADHPGLPIILITGRHNEPASRLLAAWSGARRLFRKPFDGAMLLATVQELLHPTDYRNM